MKFNHFALWFFPFIIILAILIHVDYRREIRGEVNKLNERINELENQILVMKLEMEK